MTNNITIKKISWVTSELSRNPYFFLVAAMILGGEAGSLCTLFSLSRAEGLRPDYFIIVPIIFLTAMGFLSGWLSINAAEINQKLKMENISQQKE